MSDNIVLIGFMGAGKTSVGRYLSQMLSMDFLDTDEGIEKEQGKKISDIFAEQGENAFRRMETYFLRELALCLKNTVVSTGGGMPLEKENHEWMRKMGTVVYLRTSAQSVLKRVGGDTTRPLLQGDSVKERVERLLLERAPVYEKAADYAVDTDGKGLKELAKEIAGMTSGTQSQTAGRANKAAGKETEAGRTGGER